MMNKLKTNKSILKRFKITKRGKFLKRRLGQDHFNAKESGKKTRKKHRMGTISKIEVKQLKKYIPYH